MIQDDTGLLRKIADSGMVWRLAEPAPTIPKPSIMTSSGGEQIDAGQVAKLVKDGLLVASIINIDTSTPSIGYALTEKGSQRVIDSFPHLVKGTQSNRLVYDPPITGEAVINQEVFFKP